MDESGAYDSIRPRLQALGLDPQRIENMTANGTPDCWYSLGAIEMKYVESWPARPTTNVDVSMKPEQIPWLYRRWINGGPSWILLRVAAQYFLIPGCHSRTIARGVTREAIEDHLAVWKTSPRGAGDWDELKAWLTWSVSALPTHRRSTLMRLIGDKCRSFLVIN